MKAIALAMAFWFCHCIGASGQFTLEPRNGGNGSDGPFTATANMTLDTSTQAVFNFTTFAIQSGVTVRVIGPNPATIKVQGNVQIDGILEASGQAGGNGGNSAAGGNGGAPGPGGGAGGNGGAHVSMPFNGNGQPGLGNAGGQPGLDNGPVPGIFTDPVGGGGGGGNATAGSAGGAPNAGPGPNISGAGGSAVMPCRTGSGGGGGGGDIDSLTSAPSNDGGGGGGGGGMLCLWSDATITVGSTGAIHARGGAGGTSTGNGGGGGGGSGGMVELIAAAVLVNGSVSATGGAGGGATQSNCGCSPGGAGGDGCVVIAADGINVPGSVTPMPAVTSRFAVATPMSPQGRFAVITGAANQYFVAAALSLSAAPLPTPFGPFSLEFTDPVFNLLFPTNLLGPIVQNTQGTGNNTVVVDLSFLPLAFGTEVTLFFQGVSVSSGALNGVSSVEEFRIKY